MYNIALQKIIPAFKAVLDQVERVRRERPFQAQGGAEWQDDLANAQERLLYALFEHIDDCRSILMCLLPDGSSLKSERHVKSFDATIRSYRDTLGIIVNRIKHNQRRVRFFVFYVPNDAYPGYYVEGVDTKGTIRPDPKIHRGGNTAFSFARDLRYHFIHLYAVSEALSEAAIALAGLSRESPNCPPSPKIEDELVSLAQRICALPMVFYPDELKKPSPSIEVVENAGNEKCLWLTYPSKIVKPRSFTRAQVQSGFRPDGVSSTFILPYMDQRTWQ